MKFPKINVAIPLFFALLCASCATSPATRPTPKSIPLTSFGQPQPFPMPDDFLIREIQYEDAADVATLLHDLLGVNAQVSAKSNTILIMGPTERLKLAGAIIDQVDHNAEPEDITTFVFPLKNAAADQLAATMQQLFDKGFLQDDLPFKKVPLYVIADPRTNSLLIGASAKYVAAIKQILDELDRPIPAPPTKPAAN
jgi:hypothetical protein